MPREINYSKRYDLADKPRKALEDLEQWWGGETFKKMAEEISVLPDTKAQRESIRMSCGMFGGVTGYPIEVFMDTYLGKQMEWRDATDIHK